MCQLGVVYTSFLGVNALVIGLAHLLGATNSAYMGIYGHMQPYIYTYLHAYTSCKHIYTHHVAFCWHVIYT